VPGVGDFASNRDLDLRIVDRHGSDTYNRKSDPYSRDSDPHSRDSDPYSRGNDHYGRDRVLYSKDSDPYSRDRYSNPRFDPEDRRHTYSDNRPWQSIRPQPDDQEPHSPVSRDRYNDHRDTERPSVGDERYPDRLKFSGSAGSLPEESSDWRNRDRYESNPRDRYEINSRDRYESNSRDRYGDETKVLAAGQVKFTCW
jgi:hypothetical protein